MSCRLSEPQASKKQKMEKRNVKIGLFGYGCVGQGLHDVLDSSHGFKAGIAGICVKDRSKERRLDMSRFTFNKNDILDNPEIELIVELIDDAAEAYDIVTSAMRKGKSVVTANKKMVATKLEELVEMQRKYNVSLLYEASACGSIPIIRNLEEYYDNELLISLRGIFNGSSNYILSGMHRNGSSFDEVLARAQEKGFAESDPACDIDGIDAKYKLVIITLHAWGLLTDPSEVFHYGIRNINEFDIQHAREKRQKIKLVPWAGKVGNNTISSYVMPRFIAEGKYLYNVEDEYNGVVAEAVFADKQFFYGKGAGGHATGCAVLSDISASLYNYRYEYKKRTQQTVTSYSRNTELDIYFRYNDERDLEKMRFESVHEHFRGKDYKYVTGRVNLERLYEIRDDLTHMNAFMALL